MNTREQPESPTLQKPCIPLPTLGKPHDWEHPTHHGGEEHWVKLEVSTTKLYQLLLGGTVTLSDFRCLDDPTKRCVRTLCLRACARSLQGRAVALGSGLLQ